MASSSELLTAALGATGEARSILFRHAAETDLRERIASCTLCKLHTSTTPVPWEGRSSVAIIGEAPGADEARLGRPFVGAAGRLLEELLGRVGLARSDFAYVNTICCRPPANNYDKAIEVGADYWCSGNFNEQVEMTGAWLLVPVGNVAMYKLLPHIKAGITQMRGQMRWMDRHLIMPTFHPAYLLRNPALQPTAVQDFLQIKRVLQGVTEAPVPKNYDPSRLLSTMRATEFTELESVSVQKNFAKKGWVFAYSDWLEETIVLTRDERVDPPVEGVQYTVQELVQLSHMNRTWQDARRLHWAKKVLNARII